RVLADFDNFRKRQREETARQVSLAREELILKILPILDNFQRTLEAAEAQHSYESLVEGVSLTLRQFRETLEKEGVRPIEAVGEQFNPELHEAMMRVETDEYPENTVIEEFEKGYTLNGKVLRPARVRVATSG
ncbi:MAG: nucleotide exchange factor GrpE, partial [Armatimonadota bacterium]